MPETSEQAGVWVADYGRLPNGADGAIVLAQQHDRVLVRYWIDDVTYQHWSLCSVLHGDACEGHDREEIVWRYQHEDDQPRSRRRSGESLADFRADVRSVACPMCRARPGEPCRGAAGQDRISNHQLRLNMYKASSYP